MQVAKPVACKAPGGAAVSMVPRLENSGYGTCALTLIEITYNTQHEQHHGPLNHNHETENGESPYCVLQASSRKM